MNFDTAFDMLLGHEGGYSFNAADPGGETMWGVTARVARSEGYTGEMKALPRETAATIYKARYWSAVRADSMPEAVRYSLFDAAVNSGVSQAVKWLQRALDVQDDGVLGPMTLDAAQKANSLLLAMRINAERLDFMTSLPTWASFSKGWSRRIAANLKTIGA